MSRDGLFDIDIQLQTCIETYEEQLSEFWGNQLDADDWSALNQLRRDAQDIAVTLRKRAFAMQNIGDVSTLNSIYGVFEAEKNAAEKRFKSLADKLRPKIPTDDAEKLLAAMRESFLANCVEPEQSTDRPLHLVWQYLCIEDARQSAKELRDRVSRIFELETLVEQLRRGSSLPEETMEFLALVGRTFVWGFNAECVILCRGVIDTAFHNKVSDELIKRQPPRGNGRHFGLNDRIEAACPTLIPDELRRAAQTVKCRGDKAIHSDPHATQDVLGTIGLALKVIDHLAAFPNISP